MVGKVEKGRRGRKLFKKNIIKGKGSDLVVQIQQIFLSLYQEPTYILSSLQSENGSAFKELIS